MAARATGLKDVRAAVQEVVEKEGSWDDGDWSVFVEDVVSFLLKQGKTRSKVVAAAAGLIEYGATTQEKLQGVGQGEYAEFTRKLAATGVPDAICDMLFAHYVADKSDSAFEQRRRAGRSAEAAAENYREAQPSWHRQAVERAAQDQGARRRRAAVRGQAARLAQQLALGAPLVP
jgi:hypothetical protein